MAGAVVNGLLHRHVAVTVLCAVCGFGLGRIQAQEGALAVIVHPSNPHERMQRVELCDVLLGERQRWANGGLIEVIIPRPDSEAWRVLLRTACRTNEASFRRQVAGRRAFGRASRPPQVVENDTEVRRLVAGSERALGFIPAMQLDATVKAVLIDGRSPTDSGYPIQPTLVTPDR